MPARKGGSYLRSRDGQKRLVARTQVGDAPAGGRPAIPGGAAAGASGAMRTTQEDGRAAAAKTRAPKAALPVDTAKES